MCDWNLDNRAVYTIYSVHLLLCLWTFIPSLRKLVLLVHSYFFTLNHFQPANPKVIPVPSAEALVLKKKPAASAPNTATSPSHVPDAGKQQAFTTDTDNQFQTKRNNTDVALPPSGETKRPPLTHMPSTTAMGSASTTYNTYGQESSPPPTTTTSLTPRQFKLSILWVSASVCVSAIFLAFNISILSGVDQCRSVNTHVLPNVLFAVGTFVHITIRLYHISLTVALSSLLAMLNGKASDSARSIRAKDVVPLIFFMYAVLIVSFFLCLCFMINHILITENQISNTTSENLIYSAYACWFLSGWLMVISTLIFNKKLVNILVKNRDENSTLNAQQKKERQATINRLSTIRLPLIISISLTTGICITIFSTTELRMRLTYSSAVLSAYLMYIASVAAKAAPAPTNKENDKPHPPTHETVQSPQSPQAQEHQPVHSPLTTNTTVNSPTGPKSAKPPQSSPNPIRASPPVSNRSMAQDVPMSQPLNASVSSTPTLTTTTNDQDSTQ